MIERFLRTISVGMLAVGGTILLGIAVFWALDHAGYVLAFVVLLAAIYVVGWAVMTLTGGSREDHRD